MTNKGLFSRKNITILLFAFLLGVSLLVFSSNDNEDEQMDDRGITLSQNYKSELERTAASMCAQIKGVDTVQVNITLDGGMSYVYAKNTEGSFGGTYFSSNGDPLFLRYEYPEIIGCAVVCTGAVNSDVKLELTKMLSAYLGVSSAKIYVGNTE